MNGRFVTLVITAEMRRRPRDPWKLLSTKTKQLDIIMTNTTGSINLEAQMLYPNIFGDFSSVRVTAGIVVPTDTAGITSEKYKKVADPYKEIVVGYVAETINEVCEQVGKPAPFKP